MNWNPDINQLEFFNGDFIFVTYEDLGHSFIELLFIEWHLELLAHLLSEVFHF